MKPVIDKYGKFWKDSDGRLHREDGPAEEYSNGDNFYWLEGIEYTEEEYWEKIKELKKCKLFKLNNNKIGWV